jgi:hypothetical protein
VAIVTNVMKTETVLLLLLTALSIINNIRIQAITKPTPIVTLRLEPYSETKKFYAGKNPKPQDAAGIP